jgi:CCR4-NOT transcription complex subunit 9
MSTAIHANLSPGASSSPTAAQYTAEEQRVYTLILELTSSADREHALSELSKIRESFDNLALLLWHSFGTNSFLSKRF